MKSYKPKVSIIVPVYNADRYLRDCLNSLVNQTLKDIEIIVIDDGSTDESLGIIEDYARQNDIIHYFSQKNAGVIAARKEGYIRTSGEYVGWVDADDFCELNMFEVLYNEAKNGNADVVICNYNFFPKESYKSKWFKEYKGRVNWEFIERNTIQWNKIVKRELLEELKLEKLLDLVGEGCYENVLIKARRIKTLNKCLYNYRVGHLSTSTNWKNYGWYLGNITKNVNQLEISRKGNYDKEYIEYFRYRIYYSIITALIVLSRNNEKDLYKQYKKYIYKYQTVPNDLNKMILDNNYNRLYSIFFRRVVPNSYQLTRIAAKIALK